MTIAEFSITPIGKGVSVGEYVARAVDIVDRSGLPYRLNPMGTVIEGSFDQVLALIALPPSRHEGLSTCFDNHQDRRPQGRDPSARQESRSRRTTSRPEA